MRQQLRYRRGRATVFGSQFEIFLLMFDVLIDVGCWTFCTELAVLTEVWRRSYSSRAVENPRACITLRWCGIGPEIGSQWRFDNTVSAEPYQCWRGQSCGLATCSSIVDWLHAVVGIDDVREKVLGCIHGK
jgi:hypothetical protein